jgi:hypothetical protein
MLGSITGSLHGIPVAESYVTLPLIQGEATMIILRPPCPACQMSTALARITPSTAGFDIRTFECPSCDHVHQRVVNLSDPMKSRRTRGWLQGELRTPS